MKDQTHKKKENWKFRIFRFIRTAQVGGLATIADLGILTLLVEMLHWTKREANLPALSVGFCIQFFGNRHFVFRAKKGRFSKQLILFTLVEGMAFGLVALLYHYLVPSLEIPYQFTRMIVTGIVFFGFSYPIWHYIFKVPSEKSF